MLALLLIRRAVLALAVCLLGVTAAAGGAQAATLNANNLFNPPSEAWRYTVTMGGEISVLTFEAVAGDSTRFRIREQGATLLYLPPSSSQGPSPCSVQSDGSAICKVGGTTVTNSGGSAVAPVRDQVIVRGTAHGDPAATWSPEIVSVTSTSGLMEFWSGNAGGSFTGSDIPVGTPSVPADIWHAGPNGLCILACQLNAGSDRFEGGAGSEQVDGGPGADVLIGAGGNDRLRGGADDDLILPGSGSDALFGDAGADTLSYDDAARPAGFTATFATNTPGTAGTAPYDDSTSQFAPGTGDTYDATFERYIGTPNDDQLTGGPGADRLMGAGGNDVLRGAGGPDAMDGGAGTDLLDYRERPASGPVSVTLATGSGGNASADGGGDTFASIEGVLGTPGNDTLVGSGADETFDGGSGADLVDGAGGQDAVSYSSRADGVAVTVGAGSDDGNSLDGPPGARDDLRGIEDVTGTPGADVIVGDDGSGTLAGGAGDDVLDGRGGADWLDGGTGKDTASYASRTAGADVSLPAGAGPDGDRLSGIEDLVGGAGDDRLTGDDGPNRLDGGAGADTIIGAGAIDDFFGGDGDDAIFARDGLRETIECGAGNETVELDDVDLSRDCIVPPPVPPAGPAPVPTVTANPVLTWTVLRSGRTKIRSLRVQRVLPGDTVSLTCKGRGCRKSATRKPATVKKGTSVSLTKHVKNMSLAAGATLQVRIARANAITRVVTYTIRRRKDPKRLERCLPPGQKKVARC